ncbi:MAG: sulfide/dihydroorotate dehydrogenase-like FAD/NAD-binding protein [Actinomycetota bacterium]|nr:sulfide/dihydroorotate dehydrogenase-like FAD/NAD-binding protein [Actinomycetota bacterium]
MFSVLDTRPVAPGVTRLEIAAPRVARFWKPGQFVIVRVDGEGERIPLTVVDADPAAGHITLIVQAVGYTTRRLSQVPTGGEIADVVGPLGRPSEIEAFGHVAVVGGGVGTAVAFPTARALQGAGNRVTVIVGARTAAHVILADEIRDAGCDLIVATEDGSAGVKGLVTGPLEELIEADIVDRVIAAGPIPMMRAVAETTRSGAIPTMVSLNPIMVDGTGMCGGCRVRVGGEMKFACVDGPDFDAHLVDFDGLARRNRTYLEFERAALEADMPMAAR